MLILEAFLQQFEAKPNFLYGKCALVVQVGQSLCDDLHFGFLQTALLANLAQ